MIVQNTPEWLELRKRHIGASDAPIILGVSPWKTAYQLWEEKQGLREPPQTNEAMRRGHELEPIARQAYNDYTGLFAEPEVVFHREYKWMMASLDGISIDRSIIVEIKCPGYKDHEIASKGNVPEKYYPQLQHQLAVIGLNKLHYFSYRDGDFCLIEVMRDDDYIKDMIAKEKEFWQKVQNFEPPELSNKDFIVRDDNEWIEHAQLWKIANDEMKILKEKEKTLRENLISLANDQSCRGSGIKVQRIVRKGTVDYKSIPEIQGIDLDQHRKDPTQFWKVS